MPLHHHPNNLALHLPNIQWIPERQSKIRIFWQTGLAEHAIAAIP